MDGKTVIILILAIALSGVLGYLFSQRRMRKMMKKKGGMKKRGGMKKKGGMKKRWANKIKPEGAAKGEPAESQSGVAQYAIENGL
jgi:hypothetical protein